MEQGGILAADVNKNKESLGRPAAGSLDNGRRDAVALQGFFFFFFWISRFPCNK